MHRCTALNKVEREKYLHNALDRQLRMLRSLGIGVERNTADIITPEMEQKLWYLGILGMSTPQSLLNAVFFYSGKCLALRRQTDLRFEQLVHTNTHTMSMGRRITQGTKVMLKSSLLLTQPFLKCQCSNPRFVRATGDDTYRSVLSTTTAVCTHWN